ncbi:MAG TPA: valine--tRNA ligase [Candidatus Limnocylindria bacterium]|nr:valine--tRNA ligase [Candidatus Limnocylindria bacterium]
MSSERGTTSEPGRNVAAPGSQLPKAYVPADVESRIYECWLAADVFAPDGAGANSEPGKEPFVVIQPPPNITGALHLGHALTLTLEDVMVRHARMEGHPTLWLPGLDHASIAAQYVLDKIIAADGETRESLGRERYLERMWTFINETREVMLGQERRLGASADWSRLRFTMDEGSAKAVRVSFKQLFDEGLAYRTEALINWCPGCRTSVSDLEVIPTPETGTLWTIRYHLVNETTGAPDPDAWIAVATTRPETILGDTAVAVHPEDDRYRDLVGRKVRIPFVDRDVSVIADAVVERAFGTGAVKITPAHDKDDHQTGKRHGLPMLTILGDDATISGSGTEFDGLDRYEARKRLVGELEAMGDLEGARPHEMILGRCQRSNDVIEPRLKTQWFVKTEPLAASSLEATRGGRTTIVPTRFEKTWEHWLTNIHDWNVSRQLWWGHRIPAWYCPDGHVSVSSEIEGPAACDTCGRPASELTQDPDIFDTWYSSGLWPFSTLGWPDDTDDFRRYYPGTVMETGYDIIFFWVARMMMLGIHLAEKPPFRKVYLHGLVKDPTGQKMSKSKGNIVDPLEAIDQTGADALRFALLNGTSPGNDQKFSSERLEDGRNFANKLWNATRFVLGARPASIDDARASRRESPDPAQLGPAEQWVLARAAATVAAVDRAYEDDNFGEATRVLYDATWSQYCDWGIELAKVRLADGSLPDAAREATWWSLVSALDTYLRLLHPIMPFVTEALWASLPHAEDDPELLIVARWPRVGKAAAATDGVVDEVLTLIRGIRNARAEAGIEPGRRLAASIRAPAEMAGVLSALQPAIDRLARVDSSLSDAAATEADPSGRLAVLAGRVSASLDPAAGDSAGASEEVAARERQRLEKELAEVQARLDGARSRLANPRFTERAPAAIVEGARKLEAELAEQSARLRAQLGA